MNCFKVFKARHSVNNESNSIKKENEILNGKINEILVKYGRNPIRAHDQKTLGELILDNVMVTTNKNSTNTINNKLIQDLIHSNLIQINNIKNFLNQTLLHFACENNELDLCKFLLTNGADFLCEDNYRQSPFILAAKRNNLDLIELFSSLICPEQNLKQVYRACYYASCSGHLNIVKYLFAKFKIKSECLLDDDKSNDLIEKYLCELNVLHVCCYKSYFDVVEYLLLNSIDKEEFINRPINEFRESTCLEEAFKGLLALDYGKKNENIYKLVNFTKNSERDYKKSQYEAIINLLIENNGKFSKDFIQLNGLSKMLMQVYSGPNKDLDFVHFLDCCKFLFVYKLNEIFLVDQTNMFDLLENIEQLNKERLLILTNTNLKYLNESICKLKSETELDLEKAVDEFLFKVYLISMRVLKDYKQLCLMKYVELIVNLHNSGQINIRMSKLIYLRERNSEIYDRLERLLNKPMSLKALSLIAIRNSIKCFGINKINKLNIPNGLKHELFLNHTSKPTNSFFLFIDHSG